MHVAVDDSAQMLNIFRLLGVRRQHTICGCKLQTSRNIVDVGLMALMGPRCRQAGAPWRALKSTDSDETPLHVCC